MVDGIPIFGQAASNLGEGEEQVHPIVDGKIADLSLFEALMYRYVVPLDH